jgi:hypothetical protein
MSDQPRVDTHSTTGMPSIDSQALVFCSIPNSQVFSWAALMQPQVRSAAHSAGNWTQPPSLTSPSKSRVYQQA